MKKNYKGRVSRQSSKPEADAASAISRLERQLGNIEKKVDLILEFLSASSLQKRHIAGSSNRFDRLSRYGGSHPKDIYGERNYTKIICSICKKECEVPFKPREGKPAYCRECLPKNSSPRSMKGISPYVSGSGRSSRSDYSGRKQKGKPQRYSWKRRPAPRKQETSTSD